MDRTQLLSKLLKKYNQLQCLEYTPFEYQLKAHSATDPLVFIQAANQLGKTEMAMREVTYWFRGYHPYKKLRKTRENKIWICSETIGMVIESLYEAKLKGMIPENEYTEIKDSSIGLVGIRHKLTKSTIYFKSYAKGSKKLQSVPVDLVVIDEQPDWDVFLELRKRTRQTGGQVYLNFTPLKVDPKLKNFIKKAKENKKLNHIRVTLYDCPILDGKPITKEEMRIFCDNEKETIPERDFKTTILGEWAAYEGALLPSFGESNVVPDFLIPHTWRKVLCADPASSGYAGVCVMAENPQNKAWYVVKEAMVKNIEPGALVDFYEEFASDYNLSDRFCDIHETWFIKTALKKGKKYRGVKKVSKEVMTVDLDNNFAEPSVFVFKSCTELIDQIEAYKNKDEVQKFDPVKGEFHILDSLIYGNRMIPSLPKEKVAEEQLSPLWQLIRKMELRRTRRASIFTSSM